MWTTVSGMENLYCSVKVNNNFFFKKSMEHWRTLRRHSFRDMSTEKGKCHTKDMEIIFNKIREKKVSKPKERTAHSGTKAYKIPNRDDQERKSP